MKLFKSISADVKVVDFGTSWSIVMRGSKQEIDWLFNAFFNFGATNDAHYNWNDAETEASFFTTKDRMTKFFKGFWENRLWHENKLADEAAALAKASVEDLFTNHRESRQQYKATTYEGSEYPLGKVSAVNPDDSFKDVVVENASKIGLANAQKQPVTLDDEVADMFAELQSA